MALAWPGPALGGGAPRPVALTQPVDQFTTPCPIGSTASFSPADWAQASPPPSRQPRPSAAASRRAPPALPFAVRPTIPPFPLELQGLLEESDRQQRVGAGHRLRGPELARGLVRLQNAPGGQDHRRVEVVDVRAHVGEGRPVA